MLTVYYIFQAIREKWNDKKFSKEVKKGEKKEHRVY